MKTEMQFGNLAIGGAAPIRTSPFAPWPYFSDVEIDAVTSVLRSGKVNYWTGNECKEFEREYADFVGTRFAISMANGTVALEGALHGLGIGPGDDVIVPSRTFIASASAVVARGARPVVCDIDVDSQTLTADTIRTVLTPRSKAVLVVHLAGWPCDMDPICDLAREKKLFIIEDCAQAHGAMYKGRPVGSLGDVAAFSFCQDKILTTAGEGGMLVTDNEQVWRRAWELKDHGKNVCKVNNAANGTKFIWLHDSFGSNWRMTEVQAALGRIVLKKLPEWVEKRRSLALVFERRFKQISALRVVVSPVQVYHSYYKYYVFVRSELLAEGWTRDRVLEAITAEGVPCYSGTCSEIYLEKAFPEEWRPTHRLAVAKRLGETSLMFLVHPTLSVSDVEQMADAVEKVMTIAAG